MHCLIIATFVTCTGSVPKMTPAQAAAIMKPHEFVYVAPLPRNLEPLIVVNSSPTSGPFGEFPKPPLWYRLRDYPAPTWYPSWHARWPIYRDTRMIRPLRGSK